MEMFSSEGESVIRKWGDGNENILRPIATTMKFMLKTDHHERNEKDKEKEKSILLTSREFPWQHRSDCSAFPCMDNKQVDNTTASRIVGKILVFRVT